MYRGSVCCDQCLPGTPPKKENVCKQYLSSQVSQFAGTRFDSPLLKCLEQVRFEKSTESRSGCLHDKKKTKRQINKCNSKSSDSTAPLSYLKSYEILSEHMSAKENHPENFEKVQVF